MDYKTYRQTYKLRYRVFAWAFVLFICGLALALITGVVAIVWRLALG